MLKKILLGIILNGLALYGVTYILTDIHYTGGFKFFVVAGFIIGFLNAFVRPLMKLLSFPLVFLTAGLFTIVINIIIFWLSIRVTNLIHAGDVTVAISSPLTYIVAAIIFGLLNWIIHLLISNK